jgi:hypothetical protein
MKATSTAKVSDVRGTNLLRRVFGVFEDGKASKYWVGRDGCLLGTSSRAARIRKRRTSSAEPGKSMERRDRVVGADGEVARFPQKMRKEIAVVGCETDR